MSDMCRGQGQQLYASFALLGGVLALLFLGACILPTRIKKDTKDSPSKASKGHLTTSQFAREHHDSTSGSLFWYQAYTPSVERFFIINPETDSLQYNHAGAIVHWRGRFWAAWNGNTDPIEGAPGQQIYLAQSKDGKVWTEPVSSFNKADRSVNPVAFRPRKTQWQPVFYVHRDTLICFWNEKRPGGDVVYASRLSSPSERWTHEVIDAGMKWEGESYYPVTAQDPILLKSGRIVLPMVWVARSLAESIPGELNLHHYWRRKKIIGALYSDDGSVWRTGYFVDSKPWNSLLWEPVFTQEPDGEVRLFVRKQAEPGPSKRLLMTGRVFPDSTVRSLKPVGLQVPASRAGMISQSRGRRYIMLMNDTPPGRFVQDRRNLALFLSRTGGDDFLPGAAYTSDETEREVAYSQGVEHNNALYIVYSEGSSPRGLKIAHISPAPDLEQLYLYPREHTHLYDTPGYDGEAYHFEGGPSELITEESTAGWKADQLTVGAVVHLHAEEGTIVDTRPPNGAKKGFVMFGSTNPDHGLTLFHHRVGNVTTGVRLPTERWVYIGLTVTPDSLVGVVWPNGMKREVIRRSIGEALYFNGGRIRLGKPIAASTLPDLEGQIGDLFVRTDTAWSLEQHLQRAQRLRKLVVNESRFRTYEDQNTGHFSLDVQRLPRRGYYNANKISRTGEVFLRPRLPWGSAEIVRHQSSPSTLRLRGQGSAGLELPAGAAQRRSQYRVSFSAKIDRCCGLQTLLTVGSLNSYSSLIVDRRSRDASLQVYRSDVGTVRPFTTLPLKEWADVQIALHPDAVLVRIQSDSIRLKRKDNNPARIFLGQGFVGKHHPPERTAMTPCSQITIRLDSLRGVIGHGPWAGRIRRSE